MTVLRVFNLDDGLLLEVLEPLLPISIELLKLLITDVNVFFQLLLLNVSSQFVLVKVEVLLQQSDFAHEVLVELVLVNDTELISQYLHLLLNQTKDQHLLILIECPIATQIKDIKELLRRRDSQHVKDLYTYTMVKKQNEKCYLRSTCSFQRQA